MNLRIGAGAGFAADRIAPARDLALRGRLHYLCFECLAERTLAHGHGQRRRDPTRGYNPMLERRLEQVLPPALAAGTRIVTNMGSANPPAAGAAAVGVARRLGLAGLRVAVVEGDDVTPLMTPDTMLPELGRTIGELGLTPLGANAYLGIDALLPALETGADLVISGRVADPSLFLAPIVHHYGWARDDWQRLGRGTVVGHLLECTTQVTGGYFADPGYKEVPRLAELGFPLAEVAEDGGAVLTKLDGTGGCITPLTVKEQLLYEVHDPRAYLTPDVTADFTGVRLAVAAPDRIAISGAGGTRRPDLLKVTVGFDGGFLAEAEISYAGPGAASRAALAGEIIRQRMVEELGCTDPLRLDLIGVNALHATAVTRRAETEDVRLRAALRTSDRDLAETLLGEVECLWIAGPAGGGGYRGTIQPSVLTHAAFVARDRVQPRVTTLVA